MIRTVIIDDEPMARDGIMAILHKYCPEVNIIGMAGDVESSVQLIRTQEPDLVLLDVHLLDGTAFDVLNRLDSAHYKIIFITAFEEYAITAFKFSAMDYILKPVSPDDLVAAINKVHDSLDKESMARRLELLLENLKDKPRQSNRIALRTSASMHFVNLSDIIRCQSEKNYSRFFLLNGENITVSKTLKDFEELLVPFNFVRVHQSHLVNMDHIRRFDRSEGGTLVMCDNSTVPVSMRKKEDLMKFIGQLRY